MNSVYSAASGSIPGGDVASLLDQMAMAALTGLLSDQNVAPGLYGTTEDWFIGVAQDAYAHAHAMMRVRNAIQSTAGNEGARAEVNQSHGGKG